MSDQETTGTTSTKADPTNDRISTALGIAGIGFLALVVLCVTGLVFTNHDPTQVIYLGVVGAAPLLGSIVLGKRLDGLRQTAAENRGDIQQIGTAVNGQMTAQFAELHQRLTMAGIPTTPALAPPHASGAALAAELPTPVVPDAHEAPQ